MGLGDRPREIHLPATRILVDSSPPLDAPAEDPPRNQHNYRITDDDRIGLGSIKQKCRDNLEAIALLKKLEQEERPPTVAEKRVLVRYVGWGGLPQVFDLRNEPWAKERGQLESLLTSEELESARTTTLNAHYTSPTVIGAMYCISRFSAWASRTAAFSNPLVASGTSLDSCRKTCSAVPRSPALRLIR